MSDELKRVADAASYYLNQIAGLFKEDVRLTLVVRTPGHDDRDFILTSDSPQEVIKAMHRRQEVKR